MKVGGLRFPQSAAKYHVSRLPASKPARSAAAKQQDPPKKKGRRLAALAGDRRLDDGFFLFLLHLHELFAAHAQPGIARLTATRLLRYESFPMNPHRLFVLASVGLTLTGPIFAADPAPVLEHLYLFGPADADIIE